MDTKVIIGGGQLARMMLQAWQQYDLEQPLVVFGSGALGDYAETLELECVSEAVQLKPKKALSVELDLQNSEQMLQALNTISASAVAYELEAISLAALHKSRAKFVPSLEILEMIQSKSKQKQWFAKNQIPTASFQIFKNINECQQYFQTNGFKPSVLKLARGGYDGRGVWVLRNAQDFDQVFASFGASSHDASPANLEFVLEDLVDIANEISIIIVADSFSNQLQYPAVEMFYDETNQLSALASPPMAVTEQLCAKAAKIAAKIASTLKLEGILAIEFLLTKSGEILVNEMAPRTHNSGHHTIEAFSASQFEQYIRILYGLELKPITKRSLAAAMINIVGREGPETVPVFTLPAADENVFIHNYGKANRLNRKLGHITVLDDSAQVALAKAHKALRDLQWAF